MGRCDWPTNKECLRRLELTSARTSHWELYRPRIKRSSLTLSPSSLLSPTSKSSKPVIIVYHGTGLVWMNITTKSSCLWSSYYHDHAQDPHDHHQNNVHHRKKRHQEENRLSGDPLVPPDDVLWGRILMARPSSLVWPCLQIRSCLYLKKMYNLSVNLFG